IRVERSRNSGMLVPTTGTNRPLRFPHSLSVPKGRRSKARSGAQRNSGMLVPTTGTNRPPVSRRASQSRRDAGVKPGVERSGTPGPRSNETEPRKGRRTEENNRVARTSAVVAGTTDPGYSGESGAEIDGLAGAVDL